MEARVRTHALTDEHLQALRELVIPEHIAVEESMAMHTTMRVGGPAEVLVTPDETELPKVLKLCYQDGLPVTVIGNGSNLLVGDLGIAGVVISTENVNHMEKNGLYLTAGAGVRLAALANRAKQEALGGLEFASGIPGSLGGAVFMNAGAYGGEMKDVITKVTTLSYDGELHNYAGEEMDFSYRHSRLYGKKELVLSAEVLLSRKDPAEIDALQKDFNQRRRDKQPLEYPSAGSTFKRPEGYFAGKLIEDSGLRGYRIGDAQVSEKHCGFVINLGSATAADIRELIFHVSDVVEEKYGVRLEPEVRMLGEF